MSELAKAVRSAGKEVLPSCPYVRLCSKRCEVSSDRGFAVVVTTSTVQGLKKGEKSFAPQRADILNLRERASLV